jgi:nucleotidyltransferase substrate binding protein (TIGR01987 family)
MEKINQKIVSLADAFKSLHKSVELFYEYTNLFTHEPIERNKDLLMSMRDSMIQRFEYSTDLFWKFIKIYLEEQGVNTPIISPRGILRDAIRARLLSEDEGKVCMKMVESRNKTSHTYHELMAEEIAHEIPGYYELIKSIADRLYK